MAACRQSPRRALVAGSSSAGPAIRKSAMHGIRGTPSWDHRSLQADRSGIPPNKKLALLKATHEEFSHRSRDPPSRPCLLKDRPGCAVGCGPLRGLQVQHSARPAQGQAPTPSNARAAGDVIVKPHNGDKWLMLLQLTSAAKSALSHLGLPAKRVKGGPRSGQLGQAKGANHDHPR